MAQHPCLAPTTQDRQSSFGRASLDAYLSADEVFRRYRPLVARWAARRLGAHADVEDVVQEVFVAVVRQLRSFRHEAKLSTWLFVITARIANDHRRRRLRDALPVEDAPVPDLGAPDPEAQLEATHRRRRLAQAVAALPDHYQAVLRHFEVEQLRAREVAQLLGTTPQNASVRLFRARRALAALFVGSEEGGAGSPAA